MNYNATVAQVEAEYKEHASLTAEPCPCPHCGWVQPDMIGSAAALRHSSITLFGFLILLVSSIATGLQLLPGLLGCGVSAGIVACALVLHLVGVFANPNRKRERNLEQAQARLTDGSLRLIQAGAPTAAPAFSRPVGRILFLTGLLIGSALAFLAPVVIGWPLLLGQALAMILFAYAGVAFANIAVDMKKRAHPHEVLKVYSTLATDENVPEDFRS
jgi:hypothetical protein